MDAKADQGELLALGRLLEQRDGEFKAYESPDSVLIRRAVGWCRDCICPKSGDLIKVGKSNSADLTLAIAEVILWKLGNVVPGVPTISRSIAIVGIQSFCSDPEQIVPDSC